LTLIPKAGIEVWQMHVFRLNRPIFAMPDSHPAHRFLRAFIQCRQDCVGREMSISDDASGEIDQAWYSETDNRMRTFSGFAYEFLSFDIVLDEWMTNPPYVTDSEKAWLARIHYMRTLLAECENAAEGDRNGPVLTMIKQVQELLGLWKECIVTRIATVNESRPSSSESRSLNSQFKWNSLSRFCVRPFRHD
jgi:hypothetical protein